MKKIVSVFLAALLVGFFAVNSFAQEYYPARKIFTGHGEFQRYVNFSFEVPTGNCGQFEVYAYLPACPFFGIHGKWDKKEPGSMVNKGWYRFVNNDAGTCSTQVGIYGNIDYLEQMESWWMTELGPEEIGLFIKDKWSENNFFRLPANDQLYSYYLVAPGEGMNTSLSTFFGEDFVDQSGQPIGIIAADSRGFLKKVIWKKTNKKGELRNEDIIFGPDDVIVLIYKENL